MVYRDLYFVMWIKMLKFKEWFQCSILTMKFNLNNIIKLNTVIGKYLNQCYIKYIMSKICENPNLEFE